MPTIYEAIGITPPKNPMLMLCTSGSKIEREYRWGGMDRTVLRYQSDQCVSSGSRAIRPRVGVNLGDNKQNVGQEIIAKMHFTT